MRLPEPKADETLIIEEVTEIDEELLDRLAKLLSRPTLFLCWSNEDVT